MGSDGAFIRRFYAREGRAPRRRSLSASHSRDDLELVACGYARFPIAALRDDLAVALDGDSLALESEQADQRRDVGIRYVDQPRRAVNDDFHELSRGWQPPRVSRSIAAQRFAHEADLLLEARAFRADREVHPKFPTLERGKRPFLRLGNDAGRVLARQPMSQ